MNEWIQILVQAGCVGIVALLLIKTLPGIHKAFSDVFASQRQDYLASIKQQRDDHAAADKVREDCFIAAITSARDDYMRAQAEDRRAVEHISANMARLTEVITSHDQAMRSAHSDELKALLTGIAKAKAARLKKTLIPSKAKHKIPREP